jgi:hypothetical protein
LTWAAYVHVAFQPLVVNFYFLWGQVGIQNVLFSSSLSAAVAAVAPLIDLLERLFHAEQHEAGC